MKIPNAERAVVSIEKLRDYCLNAAHMRGRHKARVFAAALGIDVHQAEWLRNELLKAALQQEAVKLETNEFGERYLIRFLLKGPAGQAPVLSYWMIRHGEDFPRLSVCYVDRKRGAE